MEIKFEKWHGIGNDFIIVENVEVTPEIAAKLCDRRFGIGADGIFNAIKTPDADIGWNFYNSDGSIAQMCGNGIRCFAKYAYQKGLVNKKKFTVLTKRGIVIPEILDSGLVKVDMGEPIFEAEKIPVNAVNPMDFEVEGYRASAVSMGNPHCLIFTNEDGKTLAKRDGAKIENAKIFPEKTNVEFINVLNFSKIEVNVWERGCGITMACGTGACASVAAGVKKGLLDNKVEVILPGGTLFIDYSDKNIFMTGEAEKVFEGVFYYN